MVVVKECQYSHVLVCKYKYYKPSYVCFLKPSEKFYYTILPNYVYPIKAKVLLCRNRNCNYDYICEDDFGCHLQDFKCKYLIHNRLCPKIPKHFCMTLPKPKFADFQPDLTYYLNLNVEEVKTDVQTNIEKIYLNRKCSQTEISQKRMESTINLLCMQQGNQNRRQNCEEKGEKYTMRHVMKLHLLIFQMN